MMRQAWRMLLCGSIAWGTTSAALGADRSGGNRRGEFKGHAQISTMLATRLLVPRSIVFTIGTYLGESYADPDGLHLLLGGFGSETIDRQFRNGTPNPLNMLLWHLALSSLARDLATVCVTHSREFMSGQFTLTEEAYARLDAACSLPEDAGQRRVIMERLWLAVIGFDAPRAELEAWLAYFGAGPAEGREQLANMLTAALENPYFLLEP